MSAIFTVKISHRLKKRMEENPAEWDQEVRDFLEQKVKQMELIKTLEKNGKRAEKRKIEGDSTVLIREDRER